MRRVVTAVTIVAACAGLVLPLAGVAAASAPQQGTDGNEVLATLRVEATKVEVRKDGADNFKKAKDGQKLREGDTIRTDATGRAEIDYSDDAYTRLDVNTTFTIVKLTEEQGERQVEGGLDAGRTWNRTEAVTESGSFEQSGGGATAAVVGTAFMVECSAIDHCEFLAVEHSIILTGDGETYTLTPREECDSTSGDLCDEITTLTIDEMAAIAWIQENLFRDLAERGLGDGPFIPSFTIVVEDGQVVAVTQNLPPDAPPTTPTTTVPELIDPDNPVIIEGGGDDPPELAVPTGPQPRIVTQDEVAISNPVQFRINVTGPDGHVIQVVFSNLPTGDLDTQTGFGVIGILDGEDFTPVVAGVPYDADQVFAFRPVQHEPGADDPQWSNTCNLPPVTSGVPANEDRCWKDYPTVFPNFQNNLDGTAQWSQSFTVTPHDVTDGVQGDAVDIEIVVVDDICAEGANRPACTLAGGSLPENVEASGAEAAPVTTAPPTTAAPTTTLPPAPEETAPTTVATAATTTTTLAPFG